MTELEAVVGLYEEVGRCLRKLNVGEQQLSDDERGALLASSVSCLIALDYDECDIRGQIDDYYSSMAEGETVGRCAPRQGTND